MNIYNDVKGLPWSCGIEVDVKNCITAQEVMHKAGLDFKVEKCELVAKMPFSLKGNNTIDEDDGDFAYNEISQQCDASKYMAMLRWHGVRVDLNESSVFMMSAATDGRYAISATNRDFFSVDNKLYWAQRGVTYADYSTYNVSEFMNGYVFDSNITALAYDLNNSYTRLVVGCENGEIYIFDISVIQNPQLIYKTRIDGKIAEIKQLLGANARQRYDCY